MLIMVIQTEKVSWVQEGLFGWPHWAAKNLNLVQSLILLFVIKAGMHQYFLSAVMKKFQLKTIL